LDLSGLYEVSNLGRIKSLSREKKMNPHGTWHLAITRERILHPSQDASGYLHVRLCKDGTITLKKVHTIVAEAFLDYDPSQYDRTDSSSLVIDHVNRDKTDNRLVNLEVVTIEENALRYAECNARGIKNNTVIKERTYRKNEFEGHSKIVTVSLPMDLMTAIDEEIGKKKISRSKYFYQALNEYYYKDKKES
jgi:hypothetical protein